MTIAVDARFFPTDEVGNYFTRKLFYGLAELHNTHQFIFFFDKPNNVEIEKPANITTVIIPSAPANFFLFKWWCDIKISLALKKYKTAVFICTNGTGSLTTKIPQLLIIQNLNFLQDAVSYPKSIVFNKSNAARFLKKATGIITFSDFTKHEIIDTYKISEEKITAIGCAADDAFRPLNWTEKEKIKEQYAQGCEYFMYIGNLYSATNFINLLKAFSIFKKWQKTNMKLLITINEKTYKEYAEKLKSYKYKSEINLSQNLSMEDFARATAGAYAMIFPSANEGFGLPVLEAMQCEVPVITSADSSMAEIAGDAALYADTATPEEIAEQMKRIFKDEALRNKLTAAGKERAKLYSFDKTIDLLWQQIEKVVSI